MKIEERLKRRRVYSELIEITPWEFCDDSLLPGPVLLHACNAMMNGFANLYWNIFNRVEDKKLTYEIPQIYLTILDEKVDFLDERRLLFNTEVSTVFDQSMIQVETGIYKSFQPFQKVAQCNWHGVECKHNDPDDWILGEFSDIPDIAQELAKLLPDAIESSVPNLQGMINRLSMEDEWQGPAITEHTMIHSYCEYGYMSAFMKYIAPLLSIGKNAILKWTRENIGSDHPVELEKKADYRNWKFSALLKKAFYHNDEIFMNTYYMQKNNKYYLKHELISKKPRILRNVFLEEYTLES